MNTSFHIIIGGSKTKKGDFIGFDLYNNSVFISQNLYLDNKFDKIDSDFPFFCLANVKEIKSENLNNIKIKILSAYKLTSEFLEIIKSVSDLIYLDHSYSILLKKILSDYDLYKEQTNYTKDNKYDFNRNKDEVNYKLPYLFISKSCFSLKQKLDKYINFYGYDSWIVNDDGEICREFSEYTLLWSIENKDNNAFKIDIIPFYKSLRRIYKEIDKPSEQPFLKIITKDSLKKFNLNSSEQPFSRIVFKDSLNLSDRNEYFDQFYKLVDSKFEINADKLQYHLEHKLDFVERLKNAFDTMFVYVITPIIDEIGYGRSNISIEKIQQNLIEIIEVLEKQNISNVIVLPPDFIYYGVLQDVDYHLYPPEEDGYDSVMDGLN